MPAEKSHRFKGRHDAKKEQYGQIYVEKFTSASLICKAFYGKMKVSEGDYEARREAVRPMEDNRMVSFSLGGMAFEYDDNKNQINFANSSCVRWLCQQSPEASHNQWTRIRS